MDYLQWLFNNKARAVEKEQIQVESQIDELKHLQLVTHVQDVKPNVAIITLLHDLDFHKTLQHLIHAGQDSSIDALLLVIDNYGGQMAIHSAIHDLIKKIATKKPVVSLVMGSALSAGYLIASAADHIIAHSCSDLGNIGVLIEISKYRNAKLSGNLEADLEVEVLYAGEFKALFNAYRELGANSKDYLRENLEKCYQQFIALVVENRMLDKNNYKEWAEGKTFIAAEALQMGLIDEIGTYFEAEAKIVELLSKRNPDACFAKEINGILFESAPAAAQQHN